MADEAPKPEKPELRIGSYRLTQQLGSGGMSSVFRAVHDETGHEVAVKVLPRTLARNPTLLQRFLREAKAAEALEHPNIVSIFDRGADQGRHYLVLEYVPGGDLHDRVRSEGPLPIAEAVRVIKEVAAGLNYAASQGLIHRDIKPANILVAPSGHVKIIDLGLALQAESEDERVTRDGTTVGTVDYMAPEQARDSHATSEKSDMYSLGCTLYFLLTGSAPFAGGDLADKLARHCTQPAPDPRTLRPEIPAALATLTRRMMAKRPENRFASYAQLIAALDAIPVDGAAAAGAGEVLDALVDDDDDDLSSEPAAPALDALVVDDSEPELPVAKPSRPTRPRTPAAAPVDVLSMAELAALDDDTPAAKSARRPRPAVPATAAAPLALDDDHDDQVVALPGGRPRGAIQFGDASSKAFVKRCVAIGTCVVLLLIGTIKLIELAREKPAATASIAVAPAERQPLVIRPLGPVGPVAPNARGTPDVTVGKKRAAPAIPTVHKPVPVWTEPADVAPAVAPEADYGAAVEARFVPEWAARPVPERLGTVLVAVRRVPAPGAAIEKPNLRLALEVIGNPTSTDRGGNVTTLELADDGPFCEDDLRVLGDARLVRAKEGFHPIVKIEEPKLPVVREQPAVMILDGKQLVLDGLDLVVDVEDLPRHQSALFECSGAALTLRNCTVTVLNPKKAAFSLVRTISAARPSRIRFERCFVRGASVTVLELQGGSVEAYVSRSVLLTGGSSVVAIPAADGTSERKLSLVRSVFGCRAPLLEWEPTMPGQRPKPAAIRALGCTFAALDGASPPILLVARGATGSAAERIQWLGEHNELVGWTALYSAGPDPGSTVVDLAAARRVWGETDARSTQRPKAWPNPVSVDRVVPEQLHTLAPARLGTLSRVAAPSGCLHEKTFALFDRPAVPGVSAEVRAPSVPAAPVAPAGPSPAIRSPAAPQLITRPLPGEPTKPITGPTPPAPKTAPAPETAGPAPLVFDTAAAPWNGDLGRFLHAQVQDAGPRLRVFVKGSGDHPFTPIQLPPGVALEILGEPASAPGEMPTWSPVPAGSAAADALIEVRDADLVLSGVNFTRGPSAHPQVLFKVDRGHFVAYRCRLLATGPAEAGGGGLIAFRARSTQPLPAHEGPFSTATDVPTCRLVDCTLITPGDVLAAEIGRGRVALTNCAVAAGGSAFVLTPASVARNRFQADLFVERCTVTAERNFVLLEPWKGKAPGPDRPWLVTSLSSAFVAQFATGAREHVLLRSAGESLAHGTLFWQGNNDAFEVPHFAAVDAHPPPLNPRPDLRRQWLEIWGANHFRNALGPGVGRIGAPSAVRFAEKLKPGEVTPRDLVLEFRERRVNDLGADPTTLQLTAPAGRPGRKN